MPEGVTAPVTEDVEELLYHGVLFRILFDELFDQAGSLHVGITQVFGVLIFCQDISAQSQYLLVIQLAFHRVFLKSCPVGSVRPNCDGKSWDAVFFAMVKAANAITLVPSDRL